MPKLGYLHDLVGDRPADFAARMAACANQRFARQVVRCAGKPIDLRRFTGNACDG